jgi:hypothetical protein
VAGILPCASKLSAGEAQCYARYMGELGLTDERNCSVAAKPENDEHFGDD